MPAPVRPPGPKGHFLLGNLPELGSDILGLFASCARDHGDVAFLKLAGWPAFVLSHPEHIEQVLVTDHKNFIKHTFFWRHVRGIFGNGLLTSEGDFWLRQRRLAQPSFHRDRIAAYGDVMVSYTERALDEWRDGESRDVHHDLMRLTLLIVAKVLFDADVAREVETIGGALDDATKEIASRFRRPFRIPDAIPIPGNLRYRRAVRRLDGVVHRIIDQHRSHDGRGDLLGLLMQARDDDGEAMSDAQLRDEAITILLAGHETTALALSWTCYLLSKHPAVAENIVAELTDVLGGTRPPTVADLPRLRFTEMVVMEAMRLYPPAYALGREAVKDCTIAGYEVRAGTSIFISPWVVHRDARWFDCPEEFLPERWAGNAAQRLPRFAYFPFGGGPRICIGNRFAMMEAVLLLACIVRRFRVVLEDERGVALFPSITLRPANGLRMTVRRRRSV
ncbi:MAG TPA: cytochrome P450 [Gemmatimonadaceae bacterium]|nr:cytochrome P450 [Gemmatimonadaceae bacterium]